MRNEREHKTSVRKERFMAIASLIGSFGAGAFSGAKANVIAQESLGQLTVAGMAMHNRKSLEKLRAAGKQLDVNVAGIFRLAEDVTPELACAVIKSIKVRGSFHASAGVKAALRDRTL
jgi:hypothetical protein